MEIYVAINIGIVYNFLRPVELGARKSHLTIWKYHVFLGVSPILTMGQKEH